ncbi:MAG: CAP domain-containing protein [Planctomycetota bacterium]
MHALNSLLKLILTSRPRRRHPRAALPSTQQLEVRSLLTTPFVLTDNEQLLLELINRARANPTAEATLQGVGLNEGLKPGEISSDPQQPLAPVQMLINAASAHAADMLDRDYFSHTTLGTSKGSSARAIEQGYVGSVGENLSWGGSTLEINQIQHVYERHQSLFKSPGHRKNMLRSSWEEIGVSLKYGQFTDNTVYNASMAVQDFGDRNGSPYITGVIYADLTDNDFYDIGEAVRSGSITATNLSTGQKLTTTLSPSGGYALQVTSGEWSVQAVYVYGGLNVRAVQFVQVSTRNVKLDFERFTTGTPDQLAVSISRSTISERGADNTASLTITQAIPQSVPITVHLSTDAADDILLPATAVIPAGQLSVSVIAQGLEDDRIELPQTVTLSALVYGLGASQTTISVLDRTFPRLPSTTQFVQTARPAISWSAVSNAASYEIWGDNTSSGQKRAAWATDIIGTSWTPPSDLALGNWTFYVRANTADARRSFWSLPAVWQIRPLPTILNSGRTEVRSAATLKWAEMPGAAAWEIWVDSVNPRVSQIVRRSEINGTSFQLPELPVGRYTWWLRARNALNEFTAWSPPGSISITDRVTGIVPAGSLFNSDLQLQWNPLPGASTYEIWVDNRTTGASGVFRSAGILTNSITIPALPPAALRIWIRARDFSAVNHPWSTPVDILRLLPTSVNSIANVNAGAPATLTWTPIAGALKYTLRIADALQNTLYTNNSISATQFAIPVPLAAGRYRFWLTAVDSAGNSLESSPFDLQVAHTTTPDPNKNSPHSQADVLITALHSPPAAAFTPDNSSSRPNDLRQTVSPSTSAPASPSPHSSNPLTIPPVSDRTALTAPGATATDAVFAAWGPQPQLSDKNHPFRPVFPFNRNSPGHKSSSDVHLTDLI